MSDDPTKLIEPINESPSKSAKRHIHSKSVEFKTIPKKLTSKRRNVVLRVDANEEALNNSIRNQLPAESSKVSNKVIFRRKNFQLPSIDVSKVPTQGFGLLSTKNLTATASRRKTKQGTFSI